MKELISDQTFENGFSLCHINALVTRDPIAKFDFCGTAKGSPRWMIAQWCNQHNLACGTERVTHDLAYIYEDLSKTVKVYPGTGKIQLDVRASTEYFWDRKVGEGWPHLLLEQVIADAPRLSKTRVLRYEADYAVSLFRDYMGARANPALHSAGVGWCAKIRNKNPDSSGYGDFFWFVVKLFDNRYPFANKFRAQDGGKEENTGKFIYAVDGHLFQKEAYYYIEPMNLCYDILPELKNAFLYCKGQGFMKDSEWEDLYYDDFNIGWEVTGTYDCGLTINRLSLLYEGED